jgi:phosphate transport system substrate-binding protein
MHNRVVRLDVAALMALLVLATVGCNSTTDENTPSPSAPTSVVGGAGSTFVAPLMSAWIDGYQRTHPKMLVKYRAIGSGGGIDEFKKGWLEFAASDAPLSDGQIGELPPAIQIPATAGPVCVVYNLPNLEHPLRLSPKSLAGIYLGRIINWQDPQIASDNPGTRLPKAAVIVVHRSDGSGTTNVFTTYLDKVDQDWSRGAGHGLSVGWPVGFGADGSKGVLNLVKQTAGTIGYLELNYAKENGVPVAAIRNQAGEFVPPSPGGAEAAIQAFKRELDKDVRAPVVDPPASAKYAYPIAGFTFFLLPKDRTSKEVQMAVRDFVSYALTTGQDAAQNLSYAKLPLAVQQKAQGLLAQLTVNGQPLK